jgi:hypothetical protein
MKTKKYSITLHADETKGDIIFAEFEDQLKIDLDLAKELVMQRLLFTQNRKHFVLIDLSNVKGITSDAKEFMQRRDTGLKDILAAAFIGGNPISNLIANIFIKTPKDFPSKFFHNRIDAFRWVQECKRDMERHLS